MPKITLYHGSLNEFAAFQKNDDPRFNTDQHRLGFFFTDNQETAERYAFLWHRDIADQMEIDDEDVTEEMLEAENANVDHFLYTAEASYRSMKVFDYDPKTGLSKIDQMQLDFNDEDFVRFREEIEAEGHDMIEFKTADGYSEFVALHAEQVAIVECRKLQVLAFSDPVHRGPSW